MFHARVREHKQRDDGAKPKHAAPFRRAVAPWQALTTASLLLSYRAFAARERADAVIWTQHKPRSLIVGVFDSLPEGVSIIERLLAAKLQPDALSLLCSEGSAERLARMPGERTTQGAGAPSDLGLRRIIVNLSPLAPLGAPASGLVATGLLKAALVTSGIGSGRGFVHALTGLGIEPDAATDIARQVAQGALVVAARVDNLDVAAQQAAALLEREAGSCVRLQIAQTPTGTRVVAGRSTSGNSRAP
jgi:hypothetical protein